MSHSPEELSRGVTTIHCKTGAANAGPKRDALKCFFFIAKTVATVLYFFFNFEGRGGGHSSWIFWASCIFNRDNLAADDLARGGGHWSLVLFSAVRVAKFEIPPLVLSRCEIPSWIRGRIEFGSLCSCKKPNINNTTTTNSNGPILDRRPIPIAYSHFLSDLRETRDGVVGRLGGNYRRLPPPPRRYDANGSRDGHRSRLRRCDDE